MNQDLGLIAYRSLPVISLSTISGGISMYHGVKRNHGSLGWGLAWFALGFFFPIITPIYAWATGYAEPKRS